MISLTTLYRKTVGAASLTITLILTACGGNPDTAGNGSLPATAAAGTSSTMANGMPLSTLTAATATTATVMQQLFYDSFAAQTLARSGQWEISNWNMSAPFGCNWSPDAMDNSSKGVVLKIDGGSGKCAEIRTWKFWQYGSFTANMSPSTAAGTVSSFFLYDGQYGTASHNEIDMTFIGGTNTLHTNYVIGGQQHSLDIDLGARGINPAAKLRNYTIEWTPTSIAWFVNGDAGEWIELRRVSASLSASMRLMFNAWRGNNQGDALYFPGRYTGQSGAAQIGYVWIGQPQAVNPAAAPVASTPATSTTVTSSPNITTNSTPFGPQKLYVDPTTAAANFVSTNPTAYPINVMKKISAQPTALWLGNWNANVNADTNRFITLATTDNAIPVLALYNIPNRDCGGYSGGGTSAAAYPSWIEQVARGIGTAKAAVILEPDALAQMNAAGCLSDAAKSERYQLLKNAVTTLKKYAPNTAVYLDAGNPTWIPAATMAQNLANAGVAAADGFALNVSNFASTEANRSYGTDISGRIGNKHFVIDTSRNGVGPTADGQWCNPTGRALGAIPTAFSVGLVDAYLWIKRPGESDGTCNGGPAAGIFWPQYAYDLAARAVW